jgi:DNA-directed RNA polymerase sigma subunit (sigma70/sigma32)
VQFGVTESRVCQLETDAIRRIREQCAPGSDRRDEGVPALAA